MNQKFNLLGIDCHTAGKAQLLRRLRALGAVVCANDMGEYRQDATLSQVQIQTTMTEAELDSWLYRNGSLQYIGTFDYAQTA